MKKFSALLILTAAMSILIGCASNRPNPNPPPGPGPGPGPVPVTNGISSAASNTILALDVTVPVAVAVECRRSTNSVPYFRLAAESLDNVATLGTVVAGRTNVIEFIREIPGVGTNALAEAAVLGGLALYEGFVARQGLSEISLNADQVAILQALAADIRKGLPPATVWSVKGFTDESRKPKAESGNGAEKFWAGLSAPFRDTPAPEFYRDQEFDLFVSGTYTFAPGGPFATGRYGLNFGSIYWVNKYFGTGAEVGITDVSNPGRGIFDYTTALVEMRYPMGRFAPYVVGALGADFESGTSFATELGAGVEVRFTANAGLRLEGRYEFHTDGKPDEVVIGPVLTIGF